MKNNIQSKIFVGNKKALSYIFFTCLGVILGCFISSPFLNLSGSKIVGVNSEMRSKSEDSFTNKLIECDFANEGITSKKLDFTSELEKFTENLKSKNSLSNISVYYRDLNNGPVININATETFSPASLLKVPILISYLKWSEDEPGLLDQDIKYEKEETFGYSQEIVPDIKLEVGKSYKAKFLIENMIRYSDNQAMLLLYNKLPFSYQRDLYKLVGVDTGIMTTPNATLSVKQYSIFFRILFNASFLTQANSEYALKLLSESTFSKGLKKGVPADIKIAHKFGERKADYDLQQFHDCGIVYYPDHPYLLCVMTRGQDVDKLIDGIYQTSDFVYKEINSQYSQK